MKLLIVGTLTNPSDKLNRDLDSIFKAIDDQHEVDVHLIESDSDDSTFKYLEKQSQKRKKFSYRNLGNLKSEIPDRVERIRYSRNQYVAFIREKFLEKKWDWIIVADLDGMNSRLTKKGLDSSFALLEKYDAVFANQKFGYYDLFALREKNWMPKDPFSYFYEQTLEINKKHRFKKFKKHKIRKEIFRAKTKLIYKNMRKIAENEPPIDVDSAFGGLGVYNPKIFLVCDYGPIDRNIIQSEHVDLHIKSVQNGFKLAINPKMINSHYNTHNINRIRIVRVIRSNPLVALCKKTITIRIIAKLKAEFAND